MQHTLIAVFDNHNDAMSAKNELLSSGFSSSDVRLSHGDETLPGGTMSSTGGAAPDAMSTGSIAASDNEPGIGASIKNFFADLFGTDDSVHSTKYSTAVERGNHVLRVNADTEAEVERAADIVERFGPVDIDEQHEKWGMASGMTEGSGAMMASRGSMSGGQSASLQFDNDRLPLNQQSLNDPNPMGTTYQEPQGSRDELSTGSYGAGSGNLQNQPGSSLGGSSLGTSQQRDTSVQGGNYGGATSGSQTLGGGGLHESQRSSMRVYSRDGALGSGTSNMGGMGNDSLSAEDDYRKDYDSNYASLGRSYDDYKPAYTYGSDMASDQRYKGRQWTDVENDLRSGWDTRYGSNTGSTWENMKNAVKRGWDRMTNDDDSYYRSHYDSNYAASGSSYDDYKPAYGFGSDKARDQKYAGRQWNDVESDLRSDWDTRYGSSTGSAWDKTKDAVKRGWDRMTTDDDDSYYRNHYNATYSSTAGASDYDSYKPAYSYGTEMRQSQMYRNRPWDEVEPDLRSGWEARNTGSTGSTWENMKAAVRHGWDKMTR